MTRGPAGRNCARECAREPRGDVLQLGRAHDMVPIEHRACPVPGRLHRHALGHTCIHHVPDRGPPEVVPETMRFDADLPGGELHPLREPRLDARGEPNLAEVSTALPGAPPGEVRARR